ncbi:MAG: hypothetical protein ACR652_22670 [Methylocystis sp.]|uniref:hypothetical protein n=1 Tax=Methylocystis sp. TaxID=1911079 RepID=UPI003DA41645
MQKLISRNVIFGGALALSSAAALATLPRATRAADGALALDNLTFTLGATTYRIPHLELKGASLSALEMAALFLGDEKSVESRLARFAAKTVLIPSLSTERKVGDATERAVYRDLVVEGVAAGRVASLRASGAEQTVERPDGRSAHYIWGASQARGVDLRQLAHLATAVRVDPQEALKPVIDEESVESLAIEDKGERMAVKTGRLVATGVKGRALATPPGQLIDRLGKIDPDRTDADPALLKDLIEAVASFDVAGIEVRDVIAAGKGEPADKPYSIRAGRIAASRIAGAGVGDFALENFSLQSSDGGRIAFGRFGLRDARLASLLDGPFPQLSHLELKGLDADLPDGRMGETSRMKFSLSDIEANFADFREIAPTKLSARLDRLAIDLAARGEAPSTAQFLALGYRDIDLSAALAGEWREKTQEAVFAPMRVEGRDMGAATLKVTFGNVSGAVFSSMALVSRAAALAASLKSVELALEGGGLVDRLLALEAKQQKSSMEKARAEYARGADLAVTAVLGGGDKAKRIADAVSAYIMKPRRLVLRLASEKGINAFDAMARKPAEILESMDVEAMAER